MRTQLMVLLSVAAVSTGCKKSGGSGGGGGGGGWLVGREGLMENIQSNGKLGAGYDLGANVDLHAIACRSSGEAWVAGDQGTLLYTSDAGTSWVSQSVPTTGSLRGVASQDSGPVFVAGDGVFLLSRDAGSHWMQLGDGVTSFKAVAAAQESGTVLALDTANGLWHFENGTLSRASTFPTANAIAVSPSGENAVVVGDHLLELSTDSGVTWQPIAIDATMNDVRIDDEANILAVGAQGAIVQLTWGANPTVQHVGTVDLHTVHIQDWSDEGVALGYAGGVGGEVLITNDLGATWAMGPNVGRDVLSVDQIGAGHR